MKKGLLYTLLSNSAEGEILEWKECKVQIDSDKLGKYFSALSNEANLAGKKCAHMLLGVANNKEVVGTSFLIDPKHVNRTKQTIYTGTNGMGSISVEEEMTSDGRVLILQIPAASAGIPVAWKGHYYARAGEDLVPLSLDKIERIRSQATRVDWSSGICEKATLSDLDPEAVKKAREGFSVKNPKLSKSEIDSWDDATFLNKAKMTINGKITKAAILLLGKTEAEHYLDPGTSKITWILKGVNGIEKDYEHFSCPLILSVELVYAKIRNLRYRYMSNRSLFPDEIDRYDPLTIREALNNCIAHQDYSLGGKINVVENEDDSLIFVNLGSFIPGDIESVIEMDSPPEYYRNHFLADAMVNVNMIDTIGSGIKKMFLSQRSKYFPLPEYDLDNQKVQLTIIGKVIDMAYAKKLVQIPDLDLKTLVALDKVQKRKRLSPDENRELRQKSLIEGRFPNVYISSYAAQRTGDKSEYMKRKGIEDKYAKVMILEYIENFKKANRADLEEMLIDKLPDIFTIKQKKDKVKNILQSLKKEGKIRLSEEREWILV